MKQERGPLVDPYEDYDNLLKRYTDAQREKDEMYRELQRLKDQQEIIKMKASSLQGKPASNEMGKQQEGY